MLSLILRPVVLSQDCFQLSRLLSSDNWGFLERSLMTDHVLRIALVAIDGCDVEKFLRSFLTILSRSNCDCSRIGHYSPRDRHSPAVRKQRFGVRSELGHARLGEHSNLKARSDRSLASAGFPCRPQLGVWQETFSAPSTSIASVIDCDSD